MYFWNQILPPELPPRPSSFNSNISKRVREQIRWEKIWVQLPSGAIAAANENCRQQVFSPLRPLPQQFLVTPLSLPPSLSLCLSGTVFHLDHFTHCTSLWVDWLSQACFYMWQLLSVLPVAWRGTNWAALLARPTFLETPSNPTWPPRRSPSSPATCASSHQPNPPMHFPFRPLSNQGIWNINTLSGQAQLLTPPADQYHILNHLTPSSPLFLLSQF